jgi:hypothetical protein
MNIKTFNRPSSYQHLLLLFLGLGVYKNTDNPNGDVPYLDKTIF